jgi:hypothetical protein
VPRVGRLLLDADDHRIGPVEMLDMGLAESHLAHPRSTICAREVEASLGLDQHVQAHQQAERILPALVVDDSLINDERPTVGQGRAGLGKQHPFLL